MGERAVLAVLDLPAVFFNVSVGARTIKAIQRTVAEQAVDVLAAFVAGVVFAVLVREEGGRIVHGLPPCFGSIPDEMVIVPFPFDMYI